MTNETKNTSQGAKSGRNMRRITEGAKKYKDMVTSVGVLVAVVGLVCLIAQTCSLGEQTHILSEQYRLTFRPYLAVENIETKDGNGYSIEILITVKNYGQVPATKFDLQEVVIGGADVTYDEETGTYTFSYTGGGTGSSTETTTPDDTTGVSITVSGYVIALIEQDYPQDIIFFPGKEQIITATVDKPTYQVTVLETNLMHIALLYSYGLERYYYVAKADLQDGIWTVVEHRGN